MKFTFLLKRLTCEIQKCSSAPSDLVTCNKDDKTLQFSWRVRKAVSQMIRTVKKLFELKLGIMQGNPFPTRKGTNLASTERALAQRRLKSTRFTASVCFSPSPELPYFCRFEQDLLPTVLSLRAHPKNMAFANLFRSSRLGCTA